MRVEMTEYAFSPPQLILLAGETVTLSLTNAGKLEHEFMAGSGAMSTMGCRSDWLAKAKAKGAAADAEHGGLSVRIPPGATAKLVLVVPRQSGQIEFGCFLQGHYEGGMRGLIVIAGGESAAPGEGQGSGADAPTETAPPDGMESH